MLVVPIEVLHGNHPSADFEGAYEPGWLGPAEVVGVLPAMKAADLEVVDRRPVPQPDLVLAFELDFRALDLLHAQTVALEHLGGHRALGAHRHAEEHEEAVAVVGYYAADRPDLRDTLGSDVEPHDKTCIRALCPYFESLVLFG